MNKILLSFVLTMGIGTVAGQNASSVAGVRYRLFSPLTFYHNVAQNEFSLSDDGDSNISDEADAALMHVYLKRPDLVQITQREQLASGNLREDLIGQSAEQSVQYVKDEEDVPVVVEEPEDNSVELVVEKPRFWTYKGDGFLQFMQNYVSDNWYKGGEGNYSAVGSLTLEANYDNKAKWKWDNKLEMKLGFMTSPSDTVHKYKSNEDLIRYTGKIGLQAANRWYYTIQVLAYTQFTYGLKANNEFIFSDFMSPLNLNIGLGMDYKVNTFNGRLTGTINMSPLAVNYRYVDRTNLAKSFGVKVDRHTHSLTDFGSQLTANLEWKMSDVLSWKTRLYSFTSYHRAEIEWENTFALRVSRYISANLFLFPRFDDSNLRDEDLGYWQFKEYSSIGFNYSF